MTGMMGGVTTQAASPAGSGRSALPAINSSFVLGMLSITNILAVVMKLATSERCVGSEMKSRANSPLIT